MQELHNDQLELASHGLLWVDDLAQELGLFAQVSGEYIRIGMPVGDAAPRIQRFSRAETQTDPHNSALSIFFAGLGRQIGIDLPVAFWDGESHGYDWVYGDLGYRCLKHTLSDYYGGSASRFVAMLENTDTSFRDIYGGLLEAWHEDSFQYETSSDNPYPEGVYCQHGKGTDDECGAELMAPDEEDGNE